MLPSKHTAVEYSSFKEWLFSLEFEQWVALFDIEASNVLKIDDCFDSIQRRKGALQTNSKTFALFLREDDSEKLHKYDNSSNLEEFIVVNHKHQLWLTTYDYNQFWQLSGAEIDRLKQLNRQICDLIVTEFEPQQRVVKIQAY